jgi:hypothetical protein
MVREYRLPRLSLVVYGYYLVHPFKLLAKRLRRTARGVLGSRPDTKETAIREQDDLLEEWFEAALGDEESAGR